MVLSDSIINMGGLKMKIEIELEKFQQLVKDSTELKLMKNNIHKDYIVKKVK